jgi:hypothetical protein
MSGVENKSQKYEIFNRDFEYGFAFFDKFFVVVFVGENVVSDYIKSREFISLNDFFKKCSIKVIDKKNKLIFLPDNDTNYNFNLLDRVINFLFKVMNYSKNNIYVYFESYKPLCLKIDNLFEKYYVFIAPRTIKHDNEKR